MKLDIIVPAAGESVTEATIAEWAKSDGDYVERDEVILVLETDKASLEVVAEKAGVLKTNFPEEEVVTVGTVVATIDTDAAKPASSSTPASADAPAAPAAPNGMPLSPAARKAVAESGVNPNNIQGTGKDGRLTKDDVNRAAHAPTPTAAAPTAAAKPAPAPLPEMPKINLGSEAEEVTRKPMSTLRKTIARRLVEAQHTSAILTTFNEIDMTAAKALRAQYKEKFKDKHGVNLGFMGLFIKATSAALREFPLVNGSIEGTDFVTRNFVNMGVAVSAPKGLMVPVIKHADKMSIAEIELAVKHYALKARNGKISIDDLSGGTFTISNGGVFGSMMSTPILNPPQSGILGLHKIEDRPVAINGEVVIRPMMYVALSYDHRIIDGKESVSFLVKVKEAMEDPARLLLNI